MRLLRKWPDLSLRTKCLLLISLPAASTVIMAGAANILTVRRTAAGDQLIRVLRAEEQIQRLRASETEISAGVRGYFLTAQDSFVDRTRSSLAGFDAARQHLSTFWSDNSLQQTRLAKVADLEQNRNEQMFGATARFRSGYLSPEQLRMEVRQVEAERMQIQEILEAMDRDNQQQLAVRLNRMRSLRNQQGAITEICLIFGVFGGAAMTLLFARGITGRIAQVQRNVEHLARDAPVDSLGGSDEIGVLNQGLLRISTILEQKTLALENALHGIAEVDASGGYVWLNHSYQEMVGCSRGQPPAHIRLTVQPEDRVRVEAAIAQMRINGRAEIATRLDQPNVPVTDVAMTFLAPGSDPNANFYVFLRDIWAGKRGDAALIRAKDAAIASNRAKTEFLARISHDIRTPLNALVGAADLLSSTPLSFDQSEYVDMFQRNCRRLVALINDFLDFSRIEAGAIRMERVPYRIRETVSDAVATFRETASKKEIGLSIEIDPAAPAWALGDPARIQQVLVNLLSNALKFTTQGRIDARVKVLSEATAGDKLRFEISDTGSGIPLEHQDKIFARFVQLPHQTTGQHGAGLGLTICRDLVELMGGSIGVVSREGSGSTFYFNLPLEAVEPVLAKPESDEQKPVQLAAGETIRILVAEDTEDNRLLLQHYLRNEPVQLRFANHGQEALDAIEQGEQFDLILMDIDMPVLDGYATTRRIRNWQRANGTATPIVALSADAMHQTVRAVIDAGCVAHIAKPVDRETLLKTILRFASLKSATAGAPAQPIAVSRQLMALIPQYLSSKERQIEEARAALIAGDFGPIRRFGHNLKGTGRGYGFPPIEDIGRQLELAAAQADDRRITEQLDALHRFVTHTQLNAGAYFDGGNNSQGSGSRFEPSGSRR